MNILNTIINGYYILRELGKGSFGCVYLGFKSEVYYGIKTIPKDIIKKSLKL